MAKKLLIVESPAKAKTINKYLGSEYKVLASFGHVRDLPKKNNSIDVNNNFLPNYQLIARNKKHVDEILLHAKKADEIYLATDQDREGEAIAWHIKEILINNKINKPLKRVTFNEITQSAIIKAVENPRDLDYNLIYAQEARLTLDFLIGFNVSPLLWRKVRTGLSAGRVQSPALRLICEREQEIRKFVPEDYFSVHMHTHKAKSQLNAKLVEFADKKIDIKTINTKQHADEIVNKLKKIEFGTVSKITQREKKKNPSAPFITSSLQIEAVRRLGFAADKIMRIAQTLYEGVELQQESIGLITYMRTDSVNLAQSAIDEIREYITTNYNKTYLPEKANVYTNKSKNAQEAHEAIRPTSILRTPQSIKQYLTSEQYKLYELIWLRTLASQFNSAILNTTAVDIQLGEGVFRLNGVVVKFDGFMKIYQDILEDMPNEDDEVKLPKLELEEKLPLDDLVSIAHQTEPKPRYTEASLIKSLEEFGIGRPSTYASIIATLKKREYVIMDKKRFSPTETGEVVNHFLTNHLSKYVDLKFTANMETTLDEIAIGEKTKLPILEVFWQELKTTIDEKQSISRLELIGEKLEEKCPECGKELIARFGKYGKFIGCSGYPECNYMRKVDKDGNQEPIVPPEEITDRVCPKDGGKLIIRVGKFGKFISCTNYPKCKHIESIESPDEISVKCPECTAGKIVSRKGRFGLFYACNNYPECKTLLKYEPLDTKCPACYYPIMMKKTTKTKGTQNICPKCDHALNVTE